MEFRDNGGPENGCEEIIIKGPNCYYKRNTLLQNKVGITKRVILVFLITLIK